MLRARWQSPAEPATAACARTIAALLREGDVITLEGDLGAGKTTLTRSIVEALGADLRAFSSPTYVLVNIYPVPAAHPAASRNIHHVIHRVIHVDAYRLRAAEDLEAAGADSLLDEHHRAKSGVMLVEWASRIEGALPPKDSRISITITPTSETSRTIDLSLPDSFSSRTLNTANSPTILQALERQPTLCPTTNTWVEPSSPTHPFANAKARDADLHKWFSGRYSISRPSLPTDEPPT